MPSLLSCYDHRTAQRKEVMERENMVTFSYRCHPFIRSVAARAL